VRLGGVVDMGVDRIAIFHNWGFFTI